MSTTRIVLLAFALGYASTPVCAQKLKAPKTALMDEAVGIQATGLRPGQRAALRVSTQDSLGRAWQATATFIANVHGDISFQTDTVIAGSHTGVSVMRLITSMDLLDNRSNAVFTPPGLGPAPLGVALIVDGKVVDSTTIIRRFIASGVTATPVSQADVPVGMLFTPAGTKRAPGILVLGGSEGGNSGVDVAVQLASHGYVALAIAYFGVDPLPAELDQIPLERFAAALDYLRSRARVDRTPLAVFGTSKGAEAALLYAAGDPRVRAVVAYTPSSVVWSCICSQADHSSWSLKGAALPSIPPGRDPAFTVAPGQPQRPVVNYRFRMRDSATVQHAAIPVERINGPIMLIAGDADDLWPSADMARQIVARRTRSKAGSADVLLIYPGAGHRIGKSYLPAGSTRVAGGRLETGGTPAANALAQADSWPRVMEFLNAALRKHSSLAARHILSAAWDSTSAH